MKIMQAIRNFFGSMKFADTIPGLKVSDSGVMSPQDVVDFQAASHIKEEVDLAMIAFRRADQTGRDLDKAKGRVSGTVNVPWEKGFMPLSHELSGSLTYDPDQETPVEFDAAYGEKGKLHFKADSTSLEYSTQYERFRSDRDGKEWVITGGESFKLDKQTGALLEYHGFPVENGKFAVNPRTHALKILK